MTDTRDSAAAYASTGSCAVHAAANERGPRAGTGECAAGETMRIELDEDLVEETVHAANAASFDRGAFHRDRERCYRAPGGVERERAFRACFRRWFERLGLDTSLHDALGERPIVAREIGLATVSLAHQRREHGIELYVADAEPGVAPRDRRRIHVRVLPAVLARHDAALALLRPELLHVADMLDPTFGYRPHLPPSQAGPTHDRMLLDRYAALWAASVAGRLVSEGRATRAIRDDALARLAGAFPMLAGVAESVFAPLLDGVRPTHDELVSFASDPRAGRCTAAGSSARTLTTTEPGSRCSLCACPSYAFASALDVASIVARIRRDVPGWTAEAPVCPQCLELYRARGVASRVSASSRP